MNELFASLVARAERAISVQDGDYLQDGLLHCGRCRTPKQAVVRVGDVEFRPKCLCRCQVEREQALADECRRREEADRIARMRREAFSERLMEDWTFANDDRSNPAISDALERYVAQFDTMRERGKGLLLYGPVGTGKTFAACEVANALLDRGIPCLLTNFTRLTGTMQSSFEQRQACIDRLSKFSLLVLDDLGAERRSEYMQEMVFQIIDARYRSGLPMLITTNLSIEQLKNPENAQFSRIYDRILERCFPIEVKGKSRRRAAVRAEYGEMKELLGV